MSIQVNGNATSVNWEALLGKLGDVQKTTGADGKESLTLTMTVGDETKVITFGAPNDLELPEVVDQTAIDSLCAKLADGKDILNLSEAEIKDIHDALSATLTSLSSSMTPETKSVMFDLYRLMALLVEVAQKQRDASREQRQAESTLVQTSILAQAAQQRTAAIVSMAASFACCAIQVGFSIAMLSKQGGAYKDQASSLKTSGVESARQNLQMTKVADTSANATKQLADVQAEVGQKASGVQGKTVAQNVNDGFADSRAAQQRLDAAKAELQGNGEKLQMYEVLKNNAGDIKAENLPEEGPLKTAYAKYEAYVQKVEQLMPEGNKADNIKLMDDFVRMKQNFSNLSPQDKAWVMDMQMKSPGAKDIGDLTSSELKANINTAYENKIAELKTSIKNAPEQIETLRLQYRSAVKSDLQRFESEYNSALHDKTELKPDAPAADKLAADTKLTQASDNLKLARATAADKLAAKDITTAKERATDVESAHTTLKRAHDVRNEDTKFLEATRNIQKFEAYNNIVYAIGNVAQNIVQNANALIQANATEKGADQQKAQEELDQTKDLFNQAQELINQVVQLMQAISSAESQSMRDAIQV